MEFAGGARLKLGNEVPDIDSQAGQEPNRLRVPPGSFP